MSHLNNISYLFTIMVPTRSFQIRKLIVKLSWNALWIETFSCPWWAGWVGRGEERGMKGGRTISPTFSSATSLQENLNINISKYRFSFGENLRIEVLRPILVMKSWICHYVVTSFRKCGVQSYSGRFFQHVLLTFTSTQAYL